MPDYEKLQELLGYSFRDAEVLRLALTHPSVAHDGNPPAPTNQRLEFLGDAVLQLALTQELFDKYPGLGEGPLTKARAKFVNRRSLAERARGLGLGQYLVMSRGEEASGGRERASALADVFEALLGAIFLDGGFEAARQFALRQFRPEAHEPSVLPTVDNPKGELQELMQARSSDPPKYHVVSISGPDHDRVFECTVHHAGAELARGRGKSKKEAESQAALAALAQIRENQSREPAPQQ